jgi:hypothetical protein
MNTVLIIRLNAFVNAFTGFSIALNDSKSLIQKWIEVYVKYMKNFKFFQKSKLFQAFQETVFFIFRKTW